MVARTCEFESLREFGCCTELVAQGLLEWARVVASAPTTSSNSFEGGGGGGGGGSEEATVTPVGGRKTSSSRRTFRRSGQRSEEAGVTPVGGRRTNSSSSSTFRRSGLGNKEAEVTPVGGRRTNRFFLALRTAWLLIRPVIFGLQTQQPLCLTLFCLWSWMEILKINCLSIDHFSL